MWILLWYSDIPLFEWYCLCVKLVKSTRDCHKKTSGMSNKNAMIDRSMTSDRPGLNELYGLNFAHCELLSNIRLCALWSNCIQVYRSVATNHHRSVEYMSNFTMICSSFFLKSVKCVKFKVINYLVWVLSLISRSNFKSNSITARGQFAYGFWTFGKQFARS